MIYWFPFSYISVFINNQLGFSPPCTDEDVEQAWKKYDVWLQRVRGGGGEYVREDLHWTEMGLWGNIWGEVHIYDKSQREVSVK